MAYSIGSIETLGGRYGFKKVRRELGIDAFGANVVVMPPHFEGFAHFHDVQDELYFVHSGVATFEVGGETHEVGPGGLVHVESTTPRKFSNNGDEDLVVLVVGGKGGYVERDGNLVSEADRERRIAFSNLSS